MRCLEGGRSSAWNRFVKPKLGYRPPEVRAGFREFGREFTGRSPGSGGGIGAIGTAVEGSGVFADGLHVIVPYRWMMDDLLHDRHWEFWSGADGGSKENLNAR